MEKKASEYMKKRLEDYLQKFKGQGVFTMSEQDQRRHVVNNFLEFFSENNESFIEFKRKEEKGSRKKNINWWFYPGSKLIFKRIGEKEEGGFLDFFVDDESKYSYSVMGEDSLLNHSVLFDEAAFLDDMFYVGRNIGEEHYESIYVPSSKLMYPYSL